MPGAIHSHPNSRAFSLASLLARATFPGLFSRAASQAGEFSNPFHTAPYSTGDN